MGVDITKAVSEKAPVFVPIENEAWRSYKFVRDGQVVETTIIQPVKLNVKRSAGGDSHRIIDAQGVSHYIPAGWVHLSWKGKSGEAYSF